MSGIRQDSLASTRQDQLKSTSQWGESSEYLGIGRPLKMKPTLLAKWILCLQARLTLRDCPRMYRTEPRKPNCSLSKGPDRIPIRRCNMAKISDPKTQRVLLAQPNARRVWLRRANHLPLKNSKKEHLALSFRPTSSELMDPLLKIQTSKINQGDRAYLASLTSEPLQFFLIQYQLLRILLRMHFLKSIKIRIGVNQTCRSPYNPLQSIS